MLLRIIDHRECLNLREVLDLITDKQFVHMFKKLYTDLWEGTEVYPRIRTKEALIEEFWELDLSEGELLDDILDIKEGLWIATWNESYDGMWVCTRIEMPAYLDRNNISHYSHI